MEDMGIIAILNTETFQLFLPLGSKEAVRKVILL
jgi:hypothetical protein